MSWFSRWVEHLGHRRWFAWFGSRSLAPLDRALHRLTGHRRALTPPSFPLLMLLLPGWKPVPLLYATDGEQLVIAGTNWGGENHPRWSDRLLRARRADVEMRRSVVPVAVEPLDDAEIGRVWPLLCDVWPAFETYRARSGRHIRVFSLTPLE